MKLQVSGQQIDIGDALRTHVAEKLTATVGKYFDNPLDAHVAFSREGSNFACSASVHIFAGFTVHAEGRSGEIYASFDEAVERMEKQLRRYKRRLKDHAKPRGVEADQAARAYVLAAPTDEAEDVHGAEPAIIAESPSSVARLRVGDAVMRLDLSGAPVLLFRNAGHGGLNVVYRRSDGNIGWIDPAFDPSKP